MAIKRDVNGIVDYMLDKVEEVDARGDIDIEKQMKYEIALLKEIRQYVRVGLYHRKLLMMAPDVARDTDIVLPVGSTRKGLEGKK